MTIHSVCVYCGSSPGRRTSYAVAAEQLGATLAREGIQLVYGGGSVGLMGIVADAALGAGGRVIGVIPKALRDLDVAHRGLTELRVVDTMHERKALMNSLSDAFAILPGALGTFDEMFEALTWGQLGIHRKPCAVFDVDDYFAPLFAMLRHAAAEGFLRPAHASLLQRATSADELLRVLRDYVVPALPKWTSPSGI